MIYLIRVIRRFSRLAELISRVIPGLWRRRRQVRRLSAKEARPKGYLRIDVGNDRDRFVVSFELLKNPVFARLMRWAMEEYGYSQKGVLHIPCDVVVFEGVVEKIRQGRTAEANDAVSALGATD